MARPTLKDIAARAGVSVSTVSYALNDASRLPLAEETKARVRQVARELGYVPNGVARSLRSQVSRTIGMLLGKPLAQPRYAAIAHGLSRGLRERGFDLAVLDEAAAHDGVDGVRGGRLDGLVFVGHDDQGVPADLAEAVDRYSVPFVSIDCDPVGERPAHASVDFDYAEGVRQVLVELVGRGIRRVVYVRPDIASPAEVVRSRALAEVGQRHPALSVEQTSTGITVDALARFDADPGGRSSAAADIAARVARALATGDPDRTAVVAAWGVDVEACYRAASERDPRIRVAALAAGPLSLDLWPNLTYSRLPLELGGREAARLITESGDSRPPEHVLLEPALAHSR